MKKKIMMKNRARALAFIFALIFILIYDTSVSNAATYKIKVSATDAPEEDALCFDLYKVYDIKNLPTDLTENVYSYAQQAFKEKIGDEGTLVEAGGDYTGLFLNKDYEIDEGVYLLVVRASVDNSTIVKTATIAGSDTSISTTYNTGLVTYAFIDNKTYTTQPQLITYGDDITLKMVTGAAEIGSIKIEKSLPQFYQGAENATFVYQVDAYYPIDSMLYSSEIYALTFTEYGTKTLTVDGLPLGATVKVTEIYTGSSYYSTVDGEKVNTKTIVVNNISEDDNDVIKFENIYNNKPKGGGGYANRFEFKLADSKWYWTRTEGNSETQNGLSDQFLTVILKLGGNETNAN